MRNLPDLTQLSHAQKDELIRALWPLQQQVQEFVAQMVMMQERIKQLEGRLALNSKNSSKPPSSEGLNKPAPKSLRLAGQNPSGGQKGHPGNTLSKATVTCQKVMARHQKPRHCESTLAVVEWHWQWWNGIGQGNAILQILPKRDTKFAAGLLQAGKCIAALATQVTACATADFAFFDEVPDVSSDFLIRMRKTTK